MSWMNSFLCLLGYQTCLFLPHLSSNFIMTTSFVFQFLNMFVPIYVFFSPKQSLFSFFLLATLILLFCFLISTLPLLHFGSFLSLSCLFPNSPEQSTCLIHLDIFRLLKNYSKLFICSGWFIQFCWDVKPKIINCFLPPVPTWQLQ